MVARVSHKEMTAELFSGEQQQMDMADDVKGIKPFHSTSLEHQMFLYGSTLNDRDIYFVDSRSVIGSIENIGSRQLTGGGGGGKNIDDIQPRQLTGGGGGGKNIDGINPRQQTGGGGGG